PPEFAEANWHMYRGDKKEKAGESALATLLKQVQGTKAIVEFLDPKETDVAKRDAEIAKMEADAGLDAPVAEIGVYVGAIDKDKKEEKKKDEKKDDKKDAKDKDKKEEPKTVEPFLKKDHKPVIRLAVGVSKTDKDHVYVRRTLEDGKTISRFKLKK